MKTERKFKPELVASKDPVRFSLQQCLLDDYNNQKVLVACDGRILVVLPAEAEDSEKGPIPPSAIKFARENAPKKATFIGFRCNGKIEFENGWSMPRPTQEEIKFPNWQQVVPKQEPKFRYSLNIDLLHRLAKAMGTDQVILEMSGEMDPAIVKSGSDQRPFGVIMPMRIP